MRPCVGISKPASMRSSVVLPQPEAPSSAKNSPRADVERDMIDRAEIAEFFRHALDAEQRHVRIRLWLRPWRRHGNRLRLSRLGRDGVRLRRLDRQRVRFGRLRRLTIR